MTLTDYRAEAEGLFAQLVAWRRDLHRHPELSFQEVRTSGIVAQTLSALGYEVRTGVARTGVVALLHGGRPGPTVMLRARQAISALIDDNLDQNAGIKIVRRALEEPLRQIVANAGEEPSAILNRVIEGAGNFGYNADTSVFATWSGWACSIRAR